MSGAAAGAGGQVAGGNTAATALFRKGLSAKLSEVENFALQEVQRLSECLASSQAENRDLRSRLEGDKRVVRSFRAISGCTGHPSEAAATRAVGTEGRRSPPFASEDSRASRAAFAASRAPGGTGDGPRDSPHSRTFVSEEDHGWCRGVTGESAVVAIESKDLHLPSLPSDCMAPRWRPRRASTTGMSSNALRPPPEKTSCARAAARRLVSAAYFEHVSFFFVIANAVWVGVDEDLNGKPLLQSPPLYQVTEHSFAVLLLCEFVVRCLAFDKVATALHDNWMLFDGFLVVLMIVDSVVSSLIILITGSDDLGAFGLWSVLRILRLLRIVRIVRICRVIPELQTIVLSMVAGMRSVMITSTMLLVMTYGFAVALRQLTASTQIGEDHFRTVPGALYTLLTQSILPDQSELLNVIMSSSWTSGIAYFVFLLLSVVLVVNLLIALLCDVVGMTSRRENEDRSIRTMSEKLEAILKTADKRYDGLVSRNEFERILEREEAVRLLQDVGVDVDALSDGLESIFAQRGRSLTFDDFKEEALQFRHTSTATVGAITATRRFIRLSLEQLGSRISAIEVMIVQLQHGRSDSNAHHSESSAHRSELDNAKWSERDDGAHRSKLDVAMWPGHGGAQHPDHDGAPPPECPSTPPGVLPAAGRTGYGEDILGGISRLWLGGLCDQCRAPPELS